MTTRGGVLPQARAAKNSAPLGSAIGPRVEPADSITLVGVTMTNLVARDFKFV